MIITTRVLYKVASALTLNVPNTPLIVASKTKEIYLKVASFVCLRSVLMINRNNPGQRSVVCVVI